MVTTSHAYKRQTGFFKLEHFCSCSPHLHLSWTYYQPDPSARLCCDCPLDRSFMIELLISSCIKCTYEYCKPAAVWAHVDTCRKIILEPSRPRHWKSEKFPFISQIPVWSEKEIPCTLWIKFSRSVGEINTHRQFANLYIKQLNCDVTFCFDSIGKSEKIGGHVTILSARSPVFAAMFQNGMEETTTREICIKEIEPDIFKQLLHYVYSGRISTELSEEIAQPLFTVADMYEISDLKNECVQYLLSCIKLENAINLMAWAHVHLVYNLKKAALAFVASHGKEICQQNDWERLIKNYPSLCLLATRRMWQ